MKRLLFVSIYMLLLFPIVAQISSITVIGGRYPAYIYNDVKGSFLEAVYVIDGIGSAKIEVSSFSASPFTWYRFNEGGAQNRTKLPETGNILSDVEGDCGYVIEQDGIETYIWVINYQNHLFELSGISVFNGDDMCTLVRLLVDGKSEKLPFYTVNGVPKEIKRTLTLTYTTLNWNEGSKVFTDSVVVETLNGFAREIAVNTPFKNTTFSLSGDQILSFWGISSTVVSEKFASTGVIARATAEQMVRDAKNEWEKKPEDGLGGSAPVEIEFKAYYNDTNYGNDDPKHIDWQFSRIANFSTIDQHYYGEDTFNYTFYDEGTTYVRLVVSSSVDTCSVEAATFVVNVGASKLEAPNFFTPYATPGANDEWKVAYKSITDFKCWIFNSWGVELFYFEDPAKGWNGKYGGKLVPPGVYFYVIEAKGADNHKYKLKGHINILGSRK